MFVYYNINPQGIKEEDCVCRAISLALGKDYNFVEYLLESNALHNNCDMLVKNCYRQMLEDKYGLEAQNGDFKTVKEIASKLHNKIVLFRLNGHLTVAINGDIYDIWNCENEKVDEFWIVS